MGVALIPAQKRGKSFLAFHTEDGICLRRIAEVYVKKPHFGDLKGLAVQIEGIAHIVRRLCIRCRRRFHLFDRLRFLLHLQILTYLRDGRRLE